MTEQSIQTRLVAPKTPRHLVPRERLLNLLQSNHDKSLIMVCCPAGYGKTTLVQNFLSKQGRPYAWLHISSDIDHLYTFFNYIVLSLREILPQFGVHTLQIIEASREKYQLSKSLKNIINHIVSTFLNEFRQHFDEDIYLVIDDLHHIEDTSWFTESMNSVLEHIPEKLHLILTTRHIPDINFTSLISRDAMLKLEIEDLHYNIEEIGQLLESIYSVKYSTEELKILEKNLGGWITGIHLMLQAYGGDFSKMNLEGQLIPENIFNSLAGQIYMNFTPEMKEFLLNTCMIDNFNRQISEKALKVIDFDSKILSLLNNHTFVQTFTIKGDDGSFTNNYNYQILFRNFLFSQLKEVKTKEETDDILKRAAEYYLSIEEIILGVHYYLIAGDYDTAIPLIKKYFKELFDKGKFEHLWKWLSRIEPEVVNTNGYLAYFHGVLCKYFAGDLDASLKYLETAIPLLKKEGDNDSVVRCSIIRAGVLINTGKIQEAINDLNDLLKLNTPEDIQSELLYFISFANYQKASYDKANEYLERSRLLAEKTGNKNVLTDIYNLSGHINLIKGDYKKAISFYEKIVDTTVNVIEEFETVCNLILLFSQSAKYDKAKSFLKKLNEIISNFPTPILKIPYLLANQAFYFESGDYKANINILLEIKSIASRMNHKRYVFLSNRLLIETYYYMDMPGKALEFYELALIDRSPDNELDIMELEVSNALIKSRMLVYSDYESIFLKAYKFYKDNDYTYNYVHMAFHLAELYLKKNNKEKVTEYLQECLAVSSLKDYISYLRREYKLSSKLFDFAKEKCIKMEFVEMIERISKE